MVQDNVLTKVLATWGAILSSIGLGWNLYRDLHDRARLKVEANVRRIVMSPNGQWYAIRPDLPIAGASKQVYVVMSVTNVGRRPAVWIGWGGKHVKPVSGKDSFFIVPTQLPKRIDEGETHSEFTETLIGDAENTRQLFAWNSAGKHWYVTRRSLKRLIADSKKYRT